MAKFALITGTSVTQVEDEKFEVGGDIFWVECPDEITTEYNYENGEFIAKPPIKTVYTVARKVGYGDIGAQLGDIFDVMESGADANEALANWKERQAKIKILFPKDNDAAVNAANDEILKRQDKYYDYLTENGLPFDKEPNHFSLELAEEYITGDWVCPVRGKYQP